MAAALLLFVITASFIIVRIGAAALELTGLTWEQAKFQALSAFTNAGFTTKESEQITRHPLRRRIIGYLIVLGNAGLVTTIGSFAGSVMGTDPLAFVINLVAIVVGVSLLFWVARKPRLAQRMRSAFQHRLLSRYGDLAPSAEALLRLEHGLELTRITLPPNSPAVGRTLIELALKDHTIQVLAIEREGDFQPIPKGDARLQAGDMLVIYGAQDKAQEVFRPKKTEALTIVPGAFNAQQSAAGESMNASSSGVA